MTKRTRRSVAGSVLVVLALVIGAVIVTALQAEGRERSKADTNDGGAWLLKRDAGYVGHVNRLVGEVTAAVSITDPGADYDIDQAPGIIVVHDRSAGVVKVVDDSVERVANSSGVAVGPDVAVHAVAGGAVIVDRSSGTVWRLSREQLLSASSDRRRRAVDRRRRRRGPVGGDARRQRRRRRRDQRPLHPPRRHRGEPRRRARRSRVGHVARPRDGRRERRRR